MHDLLFLLTQGNFYRPHAGFSLKVAMSKIGHTGVPYWADVGMAVAYKYRGEHSDRPIISNFFDWRVPCIQSGRNGGGCRGGWFLSLPILQILQSRAVSAGLLGNEDNGGSNRNSREIMPGEHVALASIPSGLSAFGAEEGGRGYGLRISPPEGDAHRSDLKAGVYGVRWALPSPIT